MPLLDPHPPTRPSLFAPTSPINLSLVHMNLAYQQLARLVVPTATLPPD